MTDPLWAQGGEYPARGDRVLITELWDHGVLGLSSCVATQRAAGANFTLDVTGGRVVVAGGSDPAQGNYLVAVDDTTDVVVSSAPSGANKRIDLLVVEVQDDAEDSGGVTGWRYRVVAGEPTTGTPAPPATPINCEALYEIGPIVNGTLAITDDLLTDVRVLAGRREEPGTIKHRANRRVPSGWLECNGQAVSRSTYADLFAEIGTDYGPGDGSTTFNLPNLRGRVAIPQSPGGSAQVDTIGETGGAYTHTLTTGEMPAHTHTMAHTHAGPSHTHSFSATTSSAGAHTHTYRGLESGQSPSFTQTAATNLGLVNRTTSSDGSHTHTVSGTTGASGTGNTGAASNSTTSSAGSGNAHNNMPPYQVVGVAVIRT